MTSRSQDGPLSIGENFLGKYEIVKVVGRGGNACVYEALHRFMGKRVAIKVLHRPGGLTREALQRGQAEAQLMNAIRHQHIVEVTDAGLAEEGLLYIVMELLEGRNLRETLNEFGTLAVEEALLLCAQIAEGTHAAHLAGAIHRDLKPDNAFITSGNRVKVLDFGVMKLVDAAAWSTQKGIAHGTPLYMSPEQLHLRPVGPQSDIYTLGLILYEALIGRHPVYLLTDTMSPTLWEIGRVAANMVPPRVDEIDPRIPEEVGRLVEHALAKAPQKRFQSMKEFAKAMLECRANWLEYARKHAIPILKRELWRPVPSRSLPASAGGADQPDTEPVGRPMFLGALSSSAGVPAARPFHSSPSTFVANGPRTEVLEEPPPPQPLPNSRKESHGPRSLPHPIEPTSTARYPASPTPLEGVERAEGRVGARKENSARRRALPYIVAGGVLLGSAGAVFANYFRAHESASASEQPTVASTSAAPSEQYPTVSGPAAAAPVAEPAAPVAEKPAPAAEAASAIPTLPLAASAAAAPDAKGANAAANPLGAPSATQPARATRPATPTKPATAKSVAANRQGDDDLEELLQKTEQKLKQDEKRKPAKRQELWIK